VRRYDLCSGPNADNCYPLHRYIATFWADTDGTGNTCVVFGADTVSSNFIVALYLSLAGTDGEMGSATAKLNISYNCTAGWRFGPALCAWTSRHLCSNLLDIRNTTITNKFNLCVFLAPLALTGHSGIAGKVMAIRLASHKKRLLGRLLSYCWLVLENTGGGSSRYSLVFLQSSSTLANGNRPVLPQGDFSGSSLVLI